MSVEDLLKYVPAAAVYHRVPLPDDENALGPWREAIQRLVEPAEDDAAWNRLHDCACHGESDDPNAAAEGTPTADACPAACESPFVFPEGEDGRHLREILETNRPALEWIDQGIERGRLQLPESETIEDFSKSMDWVVPLRCVARLLRARAMAGAADGEFDAAGRDLVRILRVGEMLCGGDAFVVHYLVGWAIEGIAVEAMRGFARLPGVPRQVRGELASAVRRNLARPDRLAQCVRFDFRNWDLLYIDRFPDGDTVEALVDAWVRETAQTTFWESDLDEAQKQAKVEARRTRCRRDMLRMLEGHPRPFDKIATVRLAGNAVADDARLLDLPPGGRPWDPRRLWILWRRRRRQRWRNRLEEKHRAFFFYSASWSLFDDAPESFQESLREAEEPADLSMVERAKPPTEEQVLLERTQLRRVANPFGLLLAQELGTVIVHFREHQQPRAVKARRELLEQLESEAP